MNMKNVFADLVNAANMAQMMDSAMKSAGYDENPYFDIYGNIADAIYTLLGEHTNTFEESVTFKVLNSTHLSVDDAAEILKSVL